MLNDFREHARKQKSSTGLASLAISNMYLDEEFLNELVKVANGKKTHEELRQEVIKKYTTEGKME